MNKALNEIQKLDNNINEKNNILAQMVNEVNELLFKSESMLMECIRNITPEPFKILDIFVLDPPFKNIEVRISTSLERYGNFHTITIENISEPGWEDPFIIQLQLKYEKDKIRLLSEYEEIKTLLKGIEK